METSKESKPLSQCPLITLVSGAGGAGRSTVAVLLATFFAQHGVETALFDADLQFGTLDQWLESESGPRSVGSYSHVREVAVSEKLKLYPAPRFPEVAERAGDEAARYVERLRVKKECVVADTGQFWSGLTANLVTTSNLVTVLFDQRVSAVSGAVKVGELLKRMGVPTSRVLYVCNRYSGRRRYSKSELASLFGEDALLFLPEGKGAVEMLVGSGEVLELSESGNAFAVGAKGAFEEMSSKLGISLPLPGLIKKRSLFK